MSSFVCTAICANALFQTVALDYQVQITQTSSKRVFGIHFAHLL